MQISSSVLLFSFSGLVASFANSQTNRAFKKLHKAAASEAAVHPQPYWGALKDTPGYAKKGDIDAVVQEKVNRFGNGISCFIHLLTIVCRDPSSNLR